MRGTVAVCWLALVVVTTPQARGDGSQAVTAQFELEIFEKCHVCDVLVEEVFHEATDDFKRESDRMQKRFTQEDIQPGERSPQGQITVNVQLHTTIQRMIEPDPLEPTWKAWDAYTPEFKNRTKSELQSLLPQLQTAFNKVAIHAGRPKMLQIKKEVCGSQCDDMLGPRTPTYSTEACGCCLAVMRDVAMLWVTRGPKDKSAAWDVLNNVCSDMDVRHPSTVIDEVQSFCEEAIDEHGKLMARLLTELPTTASSKRGASHEIAGHLSRSVCLNRGDACSKRQLSKEIAGLPHSFGVLFKSETGTRSDL